jgi:NitT/TauT family transport system substrate-binding protein
MMKHRRGPSLAASLIALTLTVAGCGGSDEATGAGSDPAGDQVREVSISVTHPTDLYGLPWQVGMEQGLFEAEGITIKDIIPGEGGGSTLRNILSGDLPFGEVATTAVVKGYLSGAPVKIIGGGVQSVSDITYVTMADNSSVQSIEDASGKKWGFSNPGSITEAMSYLLPEAVGVPVDSVNRVATGGTGAGIALLEAGDIDIFYAPPRVLVENKEKFRVLAQSSEHLPEFQQTVILANPSYLEEHPEDARALLAGYAAAVEWIHENPEEAGEIYSQVAEISSETGLEIVKDAVTNDYWGVAFNAPALETAAKGLIATDGPTDIPWSEAFTDEYLPEGHKGELPKEASN